MIVFLQKMDLKLAKLFVFCSIVIIFQKKICLGNLCLKLGEIISK